VTGNEVNEYFKVVYKALEQFRPDLVQKTTHIGHGMLKLEGGKMSSRLGNVVTGESILEDAVSRAQKKVSENTTIPEEEREGISRHIAVGAVKYAILKYSVGKDIIYNPEKSIAFDGDSGPYLQYTCVRARSVLVKAQELNIIAEPHRTGAPLTGLEQLLERFSEILELARRDHSPHHVCVYLSQLAQAFNAFYAQHKIADKDEFDAPYRVAVTEAVAKVLENGLGVLGIEVPRKM
jgi:arginyl-tRNA synthetase